MGGHEFRVYGFLPGSPTYVEYDNALPVPIVLQFFNSVSYIIGGRVFSLNDIESGILRSNRKPVGVFKKPFSRQDPRYVICLCGSLQCHYADFT